MPQGLDSPGGDYLVVEEGRGDPERLEEACRHTHRCIGEEDTIYSCRLLSYIKTILSIILWILAFGTACLQLSVALLSTLAIACFATGFNSNGILKHSLRPPHQWVRWTNHPSLGLHVLGEHSLCFTLLDCIPIVISLPDVDYCSLSVEQCPPHSHCARHHPGNYSCACDPGWRRRRGEECERGGEEGEECERGGGEGR